MAICLLYDTIHNFSVWNWTGFDRTNIDRFWSDITVLNPKVLFYMFVILLYVMEYVFLYYIQIYMYNVHLVTKVLFLKMKFKLHNIWNKSKYFLFRLLKISSSWRRWARAPSVKLFCVVRRPPAHCMPSKFWRKKLSSRKMRWGLPVVIYCAFKSSICVATLYGLTYVRHCVSVDSSQ